MLPAAPGDGGGVLSYAALPRLLGRSAKETFFVMQDVEDRGRDDDTGDGELDECERFIFFVGGWGVSGTLTGLERDGR